jgi:hypothetical protein
LVKGTLMIRRALTVAMVALTLSASRADERALAERPAGEAAPARIQDASRAGSFLAFTQAAALDAQALFAAGAAGYDGARGTAMFEASAEARVWGPIAVRGGAVYTGDRLRPSFGVRVQALSERSPGLDGSVGVFYRPEGLTEPEGELETIVAAGRHLGRTYVVGNLVYGQDPEGRERDGELRLAVLHPATARLVLAVDGRARLAIGSSAARGEPQADALFGPTAALSLGPVALTLQTGASALRRDDHTTFGAFVLGGLATAF